MGTYKAKCDICFEETDVPNYGDWDCPHCHQPYTYDECHQIRLTDAQWAALRNPSRWIPVTERLPEKGVPVIGWFPGATQSFECSLNEHDGVWCDYGTGLYLYENERPTHWMPFPEGPTDAK